MKRQVERFVGVVAVKLRKCQFYESDVYEINHTLYELRK